MATSDIIVRNFRQEDLSRVSELYSRSIVENPHFVRSEVFLKHFINYPGVDEDGAFVTEVDGKITGFAIVSVTTEQGGLKQGNIIELQVKDASSMRELIQAVLDYCKTKDVDAIVAVAPPLPGANEVLKDWLKFDTGVMMTKALSLPSILQALLSDERIRSLYAGKKVAFHIGAETLNAKVTPEEIHVSDANGELEKDVTQISMSPEVFLRIVVCQLNPYTAYLNRKVRVKGAKDTLPMLKLLYLMRIATPFYTSLADRM